MRPFNLLHYPSLAQQQIVFHRCWSSLAGLWVGSVMAWVGLHWQENQIATLTQQQALLQTDLQNRTRQGQEAAQLQGRLRWHQEKTSSLKRSRKNNSSGSRCMKACKPKPCKVVCAWNACKPSTENWSCKARCPMSVTWSMRNKSCPISCRIPCA